LLSQLENDLGWLYLCSFTEKSIQHLLQTDLQWYPLGNVRTKPTAHQAKGEQEEPVLSRHRVSSRFSI